MPRKPPNRPVVTMIAGVPVESDHAIGRRTQLALTVKELVRASVDRLPVPDGPIRHIHNRTAATRQRMAS